MEDPFQTVAVNYWEEVRAKLEESLGEIHNIALLIHNSAEFADLTDFLKKLNTGRKILYISMTRTFDSIKQHIAQVEAGIFFIDCISGGLFTDQPPKNCLFKPMPNDLNEMIGLIESSMNSSPADYVIIDSLSQFMDFSQTRNDRNSLSNFTEQLKTKSAKTILLYDDNLAQRLKSLPVLQISKIYRMEVIKEKVNWQG